MVFRRRRAAGRRAAPLKRRGYKKRALYRRKRAGVNSHGFIRLVRNTLEQQINNSTVAGTPILSGVGPVTIGTATLGNFANYYNLPCAMTYTINDLPGASSITGFADKYKIAWVKHQFYCTSTMATTNGLGQMPTLVWCIDEDDGTPSSTIQALKLKMGVKQRMFANGRPITIFVKPRSPLALTNASGSTVTSQAIVKDQWINSSFPNQPHYGLKFGIEDMNLSNTTTVNFQVKVQSTYCIVAKDLQ